MHSHFLIARRGLKADPETLQLVGQVMGKSAYEARQALGVGSGIVMLRSADAGESLTPHAQTLGAAGVQNTVLSHEQLELGLGFTVQAYDCRAGTNELAFAIGDDEAVVLGPCEVETIVVGAWRWTGDHAEPFVMLGAKNGTNVVIRGEHMDFSLLREQNRLAASTSANFNELLQMFKRYWPDAVFDDGLLGKTAFDALGPLAQTGPWPGAIAMALLCGWGGATLEGTKAQQVTMSSGGEAPPREAPPPPASTLPVPGAEATAVGGAPIRGLNALYHDVLLPVWIRQAHLGETAATTLAYRVDLQSGILQFDGGHSMPAQVIGMEAEGTWKWAWADRGHLPPGVKKFANAMQEWGTQNLVAEFVTPQLDTRDLIAGAHTFAVVAAASHDWAPYFMADNGAARMFLLVEDPRLRPQDPDRNTLARRIQSLMQSYPLVDHQRALRSGLQRLQWTPRQEGSRIMARSPAGDGGLALTFDEHHRLTSLRASD